MLNLFKDENEKCLYADFFSVILLDPDASTQG